MGLDVEVPALREDIMEKAYLDQGKGTVYEPIAIVGLSCKFPGDANSEKGFWKLLNDGKCAMTEIPESRFNIDAFYHPDSKRPGTIPVRGGHFLAEDIAAFDAPFFQTSPNEAACMDPQLRGLLEMAYLALENAGIPLQDCAGSATSVFTGSFTNDYTSVVLGDTEQEAPYAATGLATSMLANRLSWFFDFHGPSVNFDSACSSSLTALHSACQSLHTGESSMSLVGGCNLIFDMNFMEMLTKMNMLSTSSRSFSFDHRANGYARGEGMGIVVLKNLKDAIRDGNSIRAVIRSSAANQDGRTPGITQPSTEAQERLIKQAYRQAGLDMRATRFFEAHGTGTPIGDPLEAAAIGNTFKQFRSTEEPLYVGAVKSNIGHLEGASGIAGLIKTILALEKGVIPPNSGFEHTNPRINSESLKIEFPLHSIPWPCKGLRRASLNSFGFGGSNVHIVLDDARHFIDSQEPKCNGLATLGPGPSTGTCLTRKESDFSPLLLVWTASDEQALRNLILSYQNYYQSEPQLLNWDHFQNLAYTLSKGRSVLTWRTIAYVSQPAELCKLQDITSKLTKSTQDRSLAFVFTGQGAQYAGMCWELMVFSVFRESLLRASTYLKTLGCTWDLALELQKDEQESMVHEPWLSQTICTALQIAFLELLKSLGVVPKTVVGHSSGEIAAAYCAGGLSQESAWKVSYYRGKVASLAKSSHESGAMMSVALSQSDVRTYLDRLSRELGPCKVSIGCYNSPKNVTLTGDETQIDILHSWLEKQSIFARKLKTGVAYHSQSMETVSADYRALVGELQPGPVEHKECRMISTVNCTYVSRQELCRSEYWVKNLVSPVRFSEAVMLCCKPPKSTKKLGAPVTVGKSLSDIVEIGPHPALRGPVREVLSTNGQADAIRYHCVATRGLSSHRMFLQTCGELFCLGLSVDLNAANGTNSHHTKLSKLTDLPEYPFNHTRRYWVEGRISSDYRFRKSPKHELLGSPSVDWNPLEPRWRKVIRLSESPWIEDHQIDGIPIFPAAGVIAMAIEAMRQIIGKQQKIKSFELRNIELLRPVRISLEPEGVETQFCMKVPSNSSPDALRYEFRFCGYEDGAWFECATGQIFVRYLEKGVPDDQGSGKKFGSSGLWTQQYQKGTAFCDKAILDAELYDKLQGFQVKHGPTFKALTSTRYSSHGHAAAKVNLRQWLAKSDMQVEDPHVIHPTAIDGLIQLIFVALSKGLQKKIPAIVPTKIKKIWVANLLDSDLGMEPSILACGESHFTGFRTSLSSIWAVLPDNHSPAVRIEDLETTSVTDNALAESSKEPRQLCCSVSWVPDIDLTDRQVLRQYCEPSNVEKDLKSGFYEDLNLMITWHIKDAVESLDFRQQDMDAHLIRYVEWMQRRVKQLNDEGFFLGSKWSSAATDDSALQQIFDRTANYNHEGKFYHEVCSNLKKILLRQTDPLSLLFHGDLVQSYYTEVNGSEALFGPFIAWLKALTHKNPTIKILEIGAGTGGTTAGVLEVLTSGSGVRALRCGSYDFTDISPVFLERAKDRFKEHSDFISFKTLNIEEDIQDQGFTDGEYDLIIAADVLHATRDLTHTLNNTRKLLKPGGKLALFEITNTRLVRANFAFGLIKGWWAAREAERKWSPCLEESAWDQSLVDAGFSNLELVCRDHQDPNLYENSFMVTTAFCPPEDAVHSQWTLILDHQSPQQIQAAERLEEEAMKLHTRTQRLSLAQASERDDLGESICVFLLEFGKPWVYQIGTADFSRLQGVLLSSTSILWISQDSEYEPPRPHFDVITGILRSLRSEKAALKTTVLNLEKCTPGFQMATSAARLLGELQQKAVDQVEPEFREREGQLRIPRVCDEPMMNRNIQLATLSENYDMKTLENAPPLQLELLRPGSFESFEFQKNEIEALPLGSDEVIVQMQAAGITFEDYRVATGQASNTAMGREGTGVICQAGTDVPFNVSDRVCLMVPGTLKTHVRCKASAVMLLPDSMSFTDGAAIPIAGCMAYGALVEAARLQPGESVLIHSAASDVGSLAIQIARHLQADVFVTASTDEERRMLEACFEIPQRHIFDSNDTVFGDSVRAITGGKGVNVVLDASTRGVGPELLLDCLGTFGRYIEANNKAGSFRRPGKDGGFSWISLDMFKVIDERPEHAKRILESVMQLYQSGLLSLLRPIHTYRASQIADAFKTFEKGKETGKMVVCFEADDVVPTRLPREITYEFKEDATYVIAGGLGGLGKTIAQWMVDRGARNLILLSRKGPRDEKARVFINGLEGQGARVLAPCCDITQTESLSSVLLQCETLFPPIRGCVQGSMVLRDSIFEHMSHDDFRTSIDPKVQGSWNLHNMLPKGLDFFILLSSIGGVIGAPSQTNYAAGNNFKDSLARYRFHQGERHTISLDLGMMLSAGVVAETEGLLEQLERIGWFMPISQAELCAVLDYYCDPNLEVRTEQDCQAVIGIETPAGLAARGIDEPEWMQRPLFRHFRKIQSSNGLSSSSTGDGAGGGGLIDCASQLQKAASRDEANAIVVEALKKKLAKTLSMGDEADIDEDRPFNFYGVDSLSAIDIRNWFGKQLAVDVTVFDVLGNESLGSLCANAVGKSKFYVVNGESME